MEEYAENKIRNFCRNAGGSCLLNGAVQRLFGRNTYGGVCASVRRKRMVEKKRYQSSSPSKEYKKSDGTPVYVCEDCSSVCMICGDEKATYHYESLLGIVFVCNDCYEIATN